MEGTPAERVAGVRPIAVGVRVILAAGVTQVPGRARGNVRSSLC